VDAAYFGILQAHALLNVAEQAVKTRALLRDNTVSLQKNQLKSALDVSFAEVNLKDAELLVSRTRNDLQSVQAALTRLLSPGEKSSFTLEAPAQPEPLPSALDALVADALRTRPELERLRRERDAARKFASAERALNRPTLSVQGTAGVVPFGDSTLNENYAAGGVILNIPVFTGGLNSARQREANLKAQGSDQLLRDEEARITRDVQVAWLNANNAFERLAITEQLRAQAAQAYSLAEARYKVGSSSVVELSQAQLNLTSSEINQTTTRYEYLLRRSMLDYQTGSLLPRSGKAN
jgi:outer membrane protein